MKQYIEILNAYVKENAPDRKCFDAGTLLGRLCCCHQMQRGVDTETVRTYFAQLYDVLEPLPPRKRDQVITLACQLCGEHQKESFREGVLVGYQLYNELHNERK